MTVARIPIERQAVDLLAWTGNGPLPSVELELAAADIFSVFRPREAWADAVFALERDACRQAALRIRVRWLKADRWTLANSAEKLTDQSCQLVFGDLALDTATRGHVKDFAEHFLEDLSLAFGADTRVPEEAVN